MPFGPRRSPVRRGDGIRLERGLPLCEGGA